MILDANSVARITFNALLYTNAESPYTGGLSRFRFTGKLLTVLASDDYISIFDMADTEVESKTVDFCLDKTAMATIEKWCRERKKERVQFVFEANHSRVALKTEAEILVINLPDFPDEVFENYEGMEGLLLDEEVYPPVQQDRFAFHPDRVSKLYRLKSDESKAPIDIKFVQARHQSLVRFKYGKTLVGVISPIRRDLVDEDLLWPN